MQLVDFEGQKFNPAHIVAISPLSSGAGMPAMFQLHLVNGDRAFRSKTINDADKLDFERRYADFVTAVNLRLGKA